jgi:hypothetical protein
MRIAPAFAFLGQIRILYFYSKGDTLLVSAIELGDDPYFKR